MRLILVFLLIGCVTSSFGQTYYSVRYLDYSNYDENDYKRRYPYVKGYSPQFLGLVTGYRFLESQEVELGLMYNVISGPTDFGITGGYQLLYRRAIERKQNAIDLELGVYGVISAGIGVNYNFSNDGSAFGFKPFIGTSMYHFQLLYSYNFMRRKKQEWYELPRHGLTIRYVIPIKASKETEYYPLPVPNYRNLPGLNKDHPLKNETNPLGNRNLQENYYF